MKASNSCLSWINRMQGLSLKVFVLWNVVQMPHLTDLLLIFIQSLTAMNYVQKLIMFVHAKRDCNNLSNTVSGIMVWIPDVSLI